VELIIPLASQLQAMKVDVTNFLPWIETVQEYAETHNTDLTTAAFDTMKSLKIWKNLEVLQNAIKEAERRLEILGPTVRGKEAAITTIANLQHHGFTKKQINELVSLVNNWNARGITGLSHNGNNDVKKLDTELFSVGQ
jgi:uncharacterized protein involved in propanediol utilization